MNTYDHEHRCRMAVTLVTDIERPEDYGHHSWDSLAQALMTSGSVSLKERDAIPVCHPFDGFFLAEAVQVALELVDIVADDVLRYTQT